MVAVRTIDTYDDPVTAVKQAELPTEQQYMEILEQTTQIIECETGVMIQRDTTSYMRFAMHLRSLLKRIFDEKHIDTCICQMYQSVQDECQKIARCVDKIGNYFKEYLSASLNSEEKLYLIMHINCVCNG